MKKYFASFFIISILLAGCGAQITETAQPSLAIGSKKIVFEAADANTTDSAGYILTGVYKNGKDTYKLVDLNNLKSGTVAEEYAITKNGKEIYRSKMCYGAEGPIQDVRDVDGKAAFTFSQGMCVYDGKSEKNARMNIFYDGKTMNEVYNVDEARFLFAYKGKLGFVANNKTTQKNYIFFNGKKISDDFISIPTHQCCDSIDPIVDVYENGALVFRAADKEGIKDYQDYKMVEVDLNKFL